MPKQVYVPLPDPEAREHMIRHALGEWPLVVV